jgi:hypothetical protein
MIFEMAQIDVRPGSEDACRNRVPRSCRFPPGVQLPVTTRARHIGVLRWPGIHYVYS